VPLSRRVPSDVSLNRLTRMLEAFQVTQTPFVDLTESNPTRVGLPYPENLLSALADRRALQYAPEALGLRSARAAVAADYARRGVDLDPGQVVLTASTSEAYTWLFKLLCDPGQGVMVPRPSYPLFDHLTRLEGIRAEPYDLEYHGRWEIDTVSFERAPADVRAVLLVSPNNPTGSYVAPEELVRLSGWCRDRGAALIVDEVFAEYPLEASAPVTDVAVGSEVLSFTLAGLSKTVGLPQLKLGWIIVGGPVAARAQALSGLELIADTFLSVGTPVQVALPELLVCGAAVREAIHARVRRNLEALRDGAGRFPACEVPRVEGGWSAVVRVPAIRSEEELSLRLLEAEGILVHPGYFFDFPSEAFVVVSLLLPEALFAEASSRMLNVASQ